VTRKYGCWLQLIEDDSRLMLKLFTPSHQNDLFWITQLFHG
jgi:hypothetical protein